MRPTVARGRRRGRRAAEVLFVGSGHGAAGEHDAPRLFDDRLDVVTPVVGRQLGRAARPDVALDLVKTLHRRAQHPDKRRTQLNSTCRRYKYRQNAGAEECLKQYYTVGHKKKPTHFFCL